MDHVLVPVPEEHILEFRQAMLRIGLGQAGWDQDEVVRVVPLLDASAMAVVEHVAQSSLENVAVAYRHVSAELGIDVGDLLDVVTNTNDLFRREGLPLPLITDTRSQVGDDGEIVTTPTLVIVPAAAAMILEAVRRRLASGSGPVTTP